MAKRKYVRGDKAPAICDRSGLRTPYRTLRKTWDGLWVSPEYWEEKHPQLEPPPNTTDSQTLQHARPDVDHMLTKYYIKHSVSLNLYAGELNVSVTSGIKEKVIKKRKIKRKKK